MTCEWRFFSVLTRIACRVFALSLAYILQSASNMQSLVIDSILKGKE